MPSRTRRSVRRMTLAASIAAVTAVVAPVGAAHATPRTTAAAAQKTPMVDFNGDSHADMAVGAPHGTVGGMSKAGYVAVVYGSTGGVNPAKHAVLSQNTPGVPGGAETGDLFGYTVVPVDLNGDGYTDLAVGAPGEDVGSGVDAGMITILWGGPNGLTTATALDTGATPNAALGAQLESGDFDGDGKRDLESSLSYNGARLLARIGTDGKVGLTKDLDLYQASQTPVNRHSFAAGDINGDGISDLVVIVSDTDEPDSLTGFIFLGTTDGAFRYTGIAESPEGYRMSGETVAIGDINGDGYGDIVIGHAFDNYDSDQDLPTKGGALGIAYGGPNGRSTTIPPVWINQDSPGVPGVGEQGDAMGCSVAVGDINADGYADVITGVEGEDYSGLTNAGAFLMLRGSAKGLTGTGSQVFSQNSAGLPGVSETEDRFGAQVAVIPATGSDRAQVAVGDPNENAGNGAVWVLHGTSTGLTGTNTANFGSATMGAPATGAQFGAAISGSGDPVDLGLY